MAQASMYTFDYKELTTILIKEQNIHDGLWCILTKFAMRVSNMPVVMPNSEGPLELVPTALCHILQIGIQKADKANPLTVDAAEVNPRKKPSKKPKK